MTRSEKWEKCAKVGVAVLLYKKSDKNNYRRICMLSVCNRVLTRVVSKMPAW